MDNSNEICYPTARARAKANARAKRNSRRQIPLQRSRQLVRRFRARQAKKNERN